jgi:hypothetical protein
MYASITIANSIAQIFSPVLSVIVLWALRSFANNQHIRADGLEKSINEVEQNVGDELQNGIKSVLDKVDDTTTQIAKNTVCDSSDKQKP